MKVKNLAIKSKIKDEPGLPKKSVDKLIVSYSGAEGDYNTYRAEKKNNTPNRALLLFPEEMLQTLRSEGWPIRPGDLGENITTSGIEYADFKIENKYKIGSTEIEITEVCNPCKNLAFLPYVGDKVSEFIGTIKGRRGWYAKVVKEGEIRARDTIHVL